MRSIAIINQKGGVGKTTTAVNLSAALAKTGNRVMLIDLDPQAHASLHLGVSLGQDECSIYQVLTGESRIDEVRRKVDENLWLIPAHIDLAAAEMELASEVGREILLRDQLSEHISEHGEQYDFLIMDCPPSLGVLTLNALTSASEVFLPLQPHFLALHGLSKLLKTIELVAKRLNKGLKLSGIVFCMYDGSTRLAAEVTSDVQDFFGDATMTHQAWSTAKSFDSKIRRNIRLAEAPSFGQSIFQYAPSSNGAVDYTNLATEVLAYNVSQTAPPQPQRQLAAG